MNHQQKKPGSFATQNASISRAMLPTSRRISIACSAIARFMLWQSAATAISLITRRASRIAANV